MAILLLFYLDNYNFMCAHFSPSIAILACIYLHGYTKYSESKPVIFSDVLDRDTSFPKGNLVCYHFLYNICSYFVFLQECMIC